MSPIPHSRIALLLLSAMLLAPVPGAAHGGENESEETGPLTFYAHGFREAKPGNYAMNTTPPAGETPVTEACADCAGDRFFEANFTTDPALPGDVEVAPDPPARFLFWIRAYQPQMNTFVPPGTVTVAFEIATGDGTIFGQGQAERDVTTRDPVAFNATFAPALDLLKGGTTLRWNVKITGPGNVYNIAAVPYGVSPEFPFLVEFTRIIPAVGVAVDHDADVTHADVIAGNGVDLRFRLANHGSRSTTSVLSLQGVPAAASATLYREDGTKVTGALVVSGGEAEGIVLNVTGLPLGNHTIIVRADTTKGVASTLGFGVAVANPPAPPPEKDSGLPGPGAAAAALAVLGAAILARRRR